MTGTPMAEAALQYARRGFRVLPINVQTKAPLTKHGAKDATTDEATIRAWFERQYPQAGVGMALDGLVAIDVDIRDGKRGDETLTALIAKQCALPDGPVQRTRSGGSHYLFKARPGANYPGMAGPDVDLKHGAHSYICVEPTTGYCWLDEQDPWRDDVEIPVIPTWLERKAAPQRAERVPTHGMVLTPREIARYVALLPFCGDVDSHDNWLRVGMAWYHETNGSPQGLGEWMRWARTSAKFDPTEHEKRWTSFARADGPKVTMASLIHIARGNGWREEGGSGGEYHQLPDTVEQFGELAIPGDIRTPTIPADLLPGIAGDMAAAVARATQTPPAASVLCVLTVLAAVLQRRYEVAPYGDDYRETLSLWTLSVLPSGARKTAIIGAIAAPLHRYEKLERDRLRPEIARNFSTRLVAKKRIEALTQQAAKADDAVTRENLRKQIEEEELATPPELRAPRLVTGDVTPERLQNLIAEHGERMTVMSDEPGIFQILNGQYSGGMANIDVFLQAHCGAPFRVDRAGREAHVDRPALSFGLMIQPGIFAEVVQ